MFFSSYEESEFIHIKKRKGTEEDPYISIEENIEVYHNLIFLKEIPDKLEKVSVYLGENLLIEVDKPEKVDSAEKYYVDYRLGYVHLHSTKNGETLKFIYKGIGVTLYPATRIYMNGNILDKTLQDYIRRVEEHLDLIGNFDEDIAPFMERVLEIDETLDATTVPELIENGNRAQRNGDYARAEGDKVIAEINNLTALKQETANTINNARTTLEDMNEIITTGSESITELEDAVADAQSVLENMTSKGTYSATVTYYPRNVVSYNGSGYMCTSESLNVLPTDATKWKLLVSRGTNGTNGAKGDKGDTGTGFVWKNAYNNATAYSINDIVHYNGSVYIALKATTGNIPTNAEFWNLYVSKSVETITSVNGQIGLVVLDADDVGALPDTTVIPDKTSQLENDSDFETVTGAQDKLNAHISNDNKHKNAINVTQSSTGNAEGENTVASGNWSSATGNRTKAIGHASIAGGTDSYAGAGVASRISSISGRNVIVENFISSDMVVGAKVILKGVHYINRGDRFETTIESISLENRRITVASDIPTGTDVSFTFVIIPKTHTTELNSRAFGNSAYAIGDSSSAEGYNSTASGYASHAEGNSTLSVGSASHAEGSGTMSNGSASHSEGVSTRADGLASHAEGLSTRATGSYSHAEGESTHASGVASHASGTLTLASGSSSYAGGVGTQSKYAQTVVGLYNIVSTTSDTNNSSSSELFIIGNGTSSTSRGNAFKVLGDGKTYADGAYASTGADYAEMFEWLDGNEEEEDRVGLFVTFDGGTDKIRFANSEDDYVLGIVSATPSIIGDNSMSWSDKYLKDEWGRILTEEYLVPEVRQTIYYEGIYDMRLEPVENTYIDEDGQVQTRIDYAMIPVTIQEPRTEEFVVSPEYTSTRQVLNPDWNPDEEYVSREDRKEWATIGMIGKLRVRDDGTCQVGEYALPSENGIATASTTGYRVIKRNSENIITVIMK